MSAILFDISRTDDTDFLNQLREELAGNDCYSDDDRVEINAAIDLRFNQLNLLALEKKNGNPGSAS